MGTVSTMPTYDEASKVLGATAVTDNRDIEEQTSAEPKVTDQTIRVSQSKIITVCFDLLCKKAKNQFIL